MQKRSLRLIPVVLYGIFYMVCFAWLERARIPGQYHIIHSTIDDKIPFCEYFIIPYLLWFLYIAGTVVFFIFFNEDRTEYINLIINLGIGMTLFLIVSYVYPNGLTLRPDTFPRDNIFTDMVRMLYATDTPTNVLPSIHVYNSVAVFCAINTCKKLQNHKMIRFSSLALSILIILSTMFLKQHSICDVATGITLSFAAYMIIYRAYAHNGSRVRERSAIHHFEN